MPRDHARSTSQNRALVTSGNRFAESSAGFPPAVRQRALRSGSAPASLRLRSTFPFTEPQAEATSQ
jgi:hypothetical protein